MNELVSTVMRMVLRSRSDMSMLMRRKEGEYLHNDEMADDEEQSHHQPTKPVILGPALYKETGLANKETWRIGTLMRPTLPKQQE